MADMSMQVGHDSFRIDC